MNAIEVNNLIKTYRLYNSHKDRFREFFSLKRRKYHHEFHALNDVSFTVEKGKTVGIIGQNGSGKSTLLKMICGVVKPTSGKVKVDGRISSLLELGAGFNYEFTGRENVYMNGALMGFTQKAMDLRLTEIEAFADIGEYIDQPLKSYSSGMYMRLAFAAAINVNPDILIIDEILAVGDENFQNKCFQKIQEVRQSGKTILLVSHNISTIENICEKIFLLHHGNCIMEGKPSDVIPLYHSLLHGQDVLSHKIQAESWDIVSASSKYTDNSIPMEIKKWGTNEVEITNVYCWDKNKQKKFDGVFITNDEFVARIEFIAHKKISHPVFGIAIYNEDGTLIIGSNTKGSHLEISSIEGKGIIEYAIEYLPLLPGKYYFSVSVCDYDAFVAYDYWHKCLSFTITPTLSVKGLTGILCLSNKWHLLG